MSILDSLPHLATAKKRVRVADSVGGNTDTLATVFTDRECWVQQAGDSEVLDFSKRGISITNKVYFTTDPALDETHLLIIDGSTFEVKSYPKLDASAGLAVLYRVMVNQRSTQRP